MEYKECYQKIYASWLGKLIGIRLGAPIENWSKTFRINDFCSICFMLTAYYSMFKIFNRVPKEVVFHE